MEDTGVKLQYTTDNHVAMELTAGEDFDLIFLDHTLPGMDTLEVLRDIRARSGNLTTLLLIDNDWIAVEEEARSAGASGFLPAPFAMSTLQKEVSECRCRQKKQPPDENTSSLEGLRLLAAEDNDINAEILIEVLYLEGITCERAVNGREALTLFQSKPAGYYDGVLMDIQMPEMNGYEASMAIRALDREDAAAIPIIAMTANTFAEDVQKSLDAGMNAHIAKPVYPEILRSVLSRLMSK